MYSADTLRKYHDKLESAIAFYARFPVESLEICVSSGNMKVGNVPNVSLPPIKTCKHCAVCKGDCYDIKACIQYDNVINARARNYVILMKAYKLYWEQLRSKIAKLKTKHFRMHVGGDIISERYLSDMVKTANMFPYIRFWSYTKEQETVNEYVRKHGGDRKKAIPENLSIMFSMWDGKPIDNPYNFPVYYAYNPGNKPEGMFECPGKCLWCIEHHRGCPYGESACIAIH